MGKELKKGTRGANAHYLTRTKAIKKLQITLNDFRRLCILKGIVPREPPNRKKANHGNSAPTSFYHVKDINFLAHEPIIQKLREHKIFMRRMARALGKQEWTRAQWLEENRPTYKLDHIIKERYPTFIDALRDIDDAVCCIFLGASLSQHRRIPKADLQDCARLAAEWQLYVMHTRCLRKTFLSIKGIYYQAEVMGQPITWTVPYQFTQKIPMDVDFRVMRTFLEFYKTLLGFVFFKLYSDAGLVYPPPLDVKKDDAGGGIDAYALQPVGAPEPQNTEGMKVAKTVESGDGKTVTGADVKGAIEAIGSEELMKDTTEPRAIATAVSAPTDDVVPASEEFVVQPSTHSTDDPAQTNIMTLHKLATLPKTSVPTNLFAPYTFFISRESPRHILEFAIKSFGGRVGWPATVGAGSPFDEKDGSITHVVVDRPPTDKPLEEWERRRKFVQPQWVVDCINAGKILLEEPYGRGKVLPPHLSPFNAEGDGAYDPLAQVPGMEEALKTMDDEEEEEEEGVDEEDDEEDAAESSEEEPADGEGDVAMAETSQPGKPKRVRHKKSALKLNISDPDAIRKAELEAERLGVEPATFEEVVQKAARKSDKEKPKVSSKDTATEENMAKMLLSNKKRKLYDHMKKVQGRRNVEKESLERKKIALTKKQQKDSRKTGSARG